MAVGATLEECRANLEDALDSWLVLGLQLGHEFPDLDELFYVSPTEMAEIRADEELNRSLEQGFKDAKEGKGRFV